MLTSCIACPKQLNGGSFPQQHEEQEEEHEDFITTPNKKHSIKTLTTQIKGMAVRASGAYKNCKPCSGGGDDQGYEDSEAGGLVLSERLNCGYQRANMGGGVWGKQRDDIMNTKVVVVKGLGMGLSSCDSTPVSVSGRTESVVFTEEDEPKEWVAQVEPGVLITFVAIPQGGNDLKRIRFSRDLFNKWQAQRWWTDNYDKVMELYNVQRCNQSTVPPPNPTRSEIENSKVGSMGGSPTTPPLSKESLRRNFHRSKEPYSSSDSLDHHAACQCHESCGLASTPKLSNISARTETTSVDASARSSLSRADRSGELSVSDASDKETEWVEQDEPGVYITIRALPNGARELRRVRFSRERFGEMHARSWWEENKGRIQVQYL